MENSSCYCPRKTLQSLPFTLKIKPTSSPGPQSPGGVPSPTSLTSHVTLSPPLTKLQPLNHSRSVLPTSRPLFPPWDLGNGKGLPYKSKGPHGPDSIKQVLDQKSKVAPNHSTSRHPILGSFL